MVAGYLAEKNGTYYMVISYYEGNKQKKVWKTTKLPVKNNKKKAEEMLLEFRRSFQVPGDNPKKEELQDTDVMTNDNSNTKKIEPVKAKKEILFTDYLKKWLIIKKNELDIGTYGAYQGYVNSILTPYFRPLNLSISEVTPSIIQDFIMYCIDDRKVGPSTIKKYFTCINQTLDMAFRLDLIIFNPCLKVRIPKVDKTFKGDILTFEELNRVVESGKNTVIEEALYIASIYGLRRSELLGLRWSSIDFEQKTLRIDHKVVPVNIDNTKTIICKDGAKNKKSFRTFPFVEGIDKVFINKLGKIHANKKAFGNMYNNKFLDYVMVNERGDLLKPDFMSSHFKRLLSRSGIKEIRFHDLRHSCASLLCKNKVPLVQIQEWLGHSNIGTTADIYLHLLFDSKIETANVINGLSFNLNQR